MEKSEKISLIPYGVNLSGYNNGQSAANLRIAASPTTIPYWEVESQAIGDSKW